MGRVPPAAPPFGRPCSTLLSDLRGMDADTRAVYVAAMSSDDREHLVRCLLQDPPPGWAAARVWSRLGHCRTELEVTRLLALLAGSGAAGVSRPAVHAAARAPEPAGRARGIDLKAEM